MDLYDEISNKITVYQASIPVRVITLHQMAKTYDEFKKQIIENNISSGCSIEYLDPEEVWKPLRAEVEYNEAISCISAQVFYLRAHESIPVLPPMPSVQPQPQNGIKHAQTSNREGSFHQDFPQQNRHTRPLSCDHSNIPPYMQPQSSHLNSSNGITLNQPNFINPQGSQKPSGLSNHNQFNRDNTKPTPITQINHGNSSQSKNIPQLGGSVKLPETFSIDSFPDKPWVCNCSRKNSRRNTVCDICGEPRKK